MEATMLSLDHLMRANELNFALLTLIPASALAYFLTALAVGWLKDIGGFRKRKLVRQFTKSFRRLERLLNEEHDQVSIGLYIIELFTVYECIEELSSVEKLPVTLSEDLNDLARRDHSLDQKRWTIVRMRHSYKFLKHQ
jgi:hypothetical protein